MDELFKQFSTKTEIYLAEQGPATYTGLFFAQFFQEIHKDPIPDPKIKTDRRLNANPKDGQTFLQTIGNHGIHNMSLT